MGNNPKSTTGGEFANVGEAFNVQTLASVVGFDMDTADPPSTAYVGVNDKLVIQIFANSAGNPVNVNLLMLRPDNQIIPLAFSFNANAGRLEQRFVEQLMEGFILSASVTLGNPLTNQQSVYVALSLARQPFGDQNQFRQLCAGYANGFTGFGYPQAQPQRMTDGAGIVDNYLPGNPAVGTDLSFAVPVNSRFRLMSVILALSTSAVAGNRLVTLVIDDGANILVQIPSNNTQLASTVVTYMFGDSIGYLPSFDAIVTAPIPSQQLLRAGWHIRTLTAGLLAGDQILVVNIGAQEWIEAQ